MKCFLQHLPLGGPPDIRPYSVSQQKKRKLFSILKGWEFFSNSHFNCPSNCSTLLQLKYKKEAPHNSHEVLSLFRGCKIINEFYHAKGNMYTNAIIGIVTADKLNRRHTTI